jgi:hypothetical protein
MNNAINRANEFLMIEISKKIDYGYIKINSAIKINNI